MNCIRGLPPVVRFLSPPRDVALRNVGIKRADRTFVLKNVEGLKLENVRIGGQRVDGRPDRRQDAPRP